MRRDSQAVCLLLFIIFVLWFVRSWLIISLYGDTWKYVQAGEEMKQQEKEHLLLNEKYLNYTSYTTIYRTATDMGFKNANYFLLP